MTRLRAPAQPGQNFPENGGGVPQGEKKLVILGICKSVWGGGFLFLFFYFFFALDWVRNRNIYWCGVWMGIKSLKNFGI